MKMTEKEIHAMATNCDGGEGMGRRQKKHVRASPIPSALRQRTGAVVPVH